MLLGFLILQFLFQFAIWFSKIEPFLGFTAVNNNCMLKDRDVDRGRSDRICDQDSGFSSGLYSPFTLALDVIFYFCLQQPCVLLDGGDNRLGRFG